MFIITPFSLVHAWAQGYGSLVLVLFRDPPEKWKGSGVLSNMSCHMRWGIPCNERYRF